MPTLKDLVNPVSASVEAVLMGYGKREAFRATLISRKGEVTGNSVYLIAVEVKLSVGGRNLILEVPELRDPSIQERPLFNKIQEFRNVNPNTDIALVIYKDSLSESAGYDGSIRALVPLPVADKTIAYSARLDLDDYMRAMFPSKDLQSLDC